MCVRCNRAAAYRQPNAIINQKLGNCRLTVDDQDAAGRLHAAFLPTSICLDPQGAYLIPLWAARREPVGSPPDVRQETRLVITPPLLYL